MNYPYYYINTISEQENTIQRLLKEISFMREEDIYIDSIGTTWNRPTAEAYQKACVALSRANRKNVVYKEALKVIADDGCENKQCGKYSCVECLQKIANNALEEVK